jgi:hypothetical protein
MGVSPLSPRAGIARDVTDTVVVGRMTRRYVGVHSHLDLVHHSGPNPSMGSGCLGCSLVWVVHVSRLGLVALSVSLLSLARVTTDMSPFALLQDPQHLPGPRGPRLQIASPPRHRHRDPPRCHRSHLQDRLLLVSHPNFSTITFAFRHTFASIAMRVSRLTLFIAL